MTAIAALEAALRDDFSLDNLQVYGDALLAAGDPRGQLIAIDLHIARHGPSRELAYRRRQRLREWLELPKAVDPTNGPWSSVQFAFGFVDELRIDQAGEVLRSPAGPYVRRLMLAGRIPRMVAALEALGAAPRPWLERLTLVSRVPSGVPPAVWSHEPPVLDQGWIAPVIAATPRMRRFEIAGSHVIRAFPHPGVTHLRVDGIDALQAILEPRPAMPAVEALELAFAPALDWPVPMPTPWPALVPAASFPALTRLELSENWRPATTDTQLDVFDVLPTLGVREQLEVLRLWAISRPEDVRRFARARLPRLRTLELEHLPDRPLELPDVAVTKVELHWPRDPGPVDTLWITVPGAPPRQLSPLALARECRFARSTLTPAVLEALQHVWQIIEALPYGTSSMAVSSTVLRRALEGLGYLDASHGGLWPWAMVLRALRALPAEHEVWMTMVQP